MKFLIRIQFCSIVFFTKPVLGLCLLFHVPLLPTHFSWQNPECGKGFFQCRNIFCMMEYVGDESGTSIVFHAFRYLLEVEKRMMTVFAAIGGNIAAETRMAKYGGARIHYAFLCAVIFVKHTQKLVIVHDVQRHEYPCIGLQDILG